jgi:glycosyltransferase
VKVSVVTAVYNNVTCLSDCIQSLSSQAYPDIEHIIIDGGSTDGTLDVIACLTSNTLRLTTHVSRVVSEPDNGIYDALNKGIRMATGDVIGFLHADDMYADKTVIEKVVKAMSQKNCDSCYGDLLYVDKHNTDKTIRYWRAGEFSSKLLRRGWMPPHPTFFVRRELYEKAGVFDPRFRIAADYELMLRFLGKYKISTCYIPEVLIKMRTGGASNRSIPNILRKSSEDFSAMKMHSIGGLPTLLRKNLSKLPQFFKKT